MSSRKKAQPSASSNANSRLSSSTKKNNESKNKAQPNKEGKQAPAELNSSSSSSSSSSLSPLYSAKTPQDSAVEMREMVMPHQANPQNTIFGGVVMSWIDIAAAMVASRHCARPVVTAHISSIDFKAPIKVGYHVRILASLNYVGSTSMEIGVKVISEDPFSGHARTATTAYLTFVALDEFGRPTPVPPLTLMTEDDKRRFENAKQRVLYRKELNKKLR